MELIMIAIFMYLFPTAVAVGRHHYNKGAIFTLNLLLGWTIIGWIASLVWSMTKRPPMRA